MGPPRNVFGEYIGPVVIEVDIRSGINMSTVVFSGDDNPRPIITDEATVDGDFIRELMDDAKKLQMMNRGR